MRQHHYERGMHEEMRANIRKRIDADSIEFRADGWIEMRLPSWEVRLSNLDAVAYLCASKEITLSTEREDSGCDTCGGSTYIVAMIEAPDLDRVLRDGK